MGILTAAWAAGTANPSEASAQDCFPCIKGLGTGVEHFGEHISQLDNPWFSHEVILTDREFAERTGQTHMTYGRLQLFFGIDCAANDPLCVSDRMHSARSTSSERITDGTFTFFGFGPKLGHQWADLFFEKTQENCEVVEFERFKARVDREIIIVPVHVAVEIPEGHASLEQFGEPGAWRQFLALFDDDFSDPERTVTSSPPGGCVSTHVTQLLQDPTRWVPKEVHRMYPIHDVGLVSLSGREVARPDDIFVQCGVQFRLTSVTLLPVPEPTITDDSVEPNGAIANFAERILSAPGRILLYGDPTIAGPVVAFMQSVGRASNGTLPTGRAFGSVAGVDYSRMNDRTVAHELGHVLGIRSSSSNSDSHPVCRDDQRDTAGQLMCANSAPISWEGATSGVRASNGVTRTVPKRAIQTIRIRAPRCRCSGPSAAM